MPYRERARQRDEARQAAATMRPAVDRLFDQGLRPAEIAAQRRADRNLSEPLLSAGLNVLLRHCSDMPEQERDKPPGD